MKHDLGHLNQPVSAVMRQDVAILREELTIRQALDTIRQQGIGEKIIYFYVINAENQLIGVLPTRRLLTAPLDQCLFEVMITHVTAVPQTATVLEACEAFIIHRFLAFPVVDERRRIVGVIDADLLTDEAFDIAEHEQTDALFESIGFHLSEVRMASPFRAFYFRFPWLLATISGGTICALLVSVFETTLAASLVLAFFLTLVLGLGESVSIQSMTVAIQTLRTIKPTLRWYFGALRREAGTALLLGAVCGTTVGLIVWLWQGTVFAALSVGSGIWLSLIAAGFFGLSVPACLHALKLDPKIAAGPITLALTDIFTLLFYFTLAVLLL